MANPIDSLMALSCKQFSREIASGVPARPGFYHKLQFWTHYAICEFCRRYWHELNTIGHVHRKNSTLDASFMARLDAIKRRLHDKLKGRTI